MDNDFQLFTSLRYDPTLLQVSVSKLSYGGWNSVNSSPLYMLDYHRDRMLRAATHWGWNAAVDVLQGDSGLKRIVELVESSIQEDQQSPLRVRIAITKDGELSITSGPVPETTLANLFPESLPPPERTEHEGSGQDIPSKSPGYEILVDTPITTRSEHTHFKTTKRAAYDGARQRAQISLSDLKEVLIVNEANGAVMEGSTTTPYFWRDGRWVTPAVSKEYNLEDGSGGQSGTSRRWALERFVNIAFSGRLERPFFRMDDALFQTHADLRKRLALHKIKAIPNSNYKRHGTKSYVSVLNRFGFQPTQPGPYYQKFIKSDDVPPTAAPGVRPGRIWAGLFKKVEGKKEGGEVTAEDQQNDAEYLCEVTIGTGVGSDIQKVMLDFDTGSADLWVSHKKFDHTKSSSFQLAKDKTWKIQYGDGSSASGTVGTDVLVLGGIIIKKQVIEIANEMSAQFSEGTMDGLLGLAFSKINTVQSGGKPDPQLTPVDNMIAQEDIPKEAELFTSAIYSNRDEDRRSFYTFGWIDEDLVKASGEEIAWTNIDKSEGFWMFSSEHTSVNGERITIEGNQAIADTGTTLALVTDKVCDALYSKIPGAEYNAEYQGWTIPQSIPVDELPDFSIAVGGKEFVIQKEDLIFAPADNNSFYGGVQSRGENPFDILGNTFLKSIYAIWDQGNSRFGAVRKIEPFQHPIKYDLQPLSLDERTKLGIKKGYGDINTIPFTERA
ncbi:aspartic peptidase domain-containing protein [Chaetomium tenue]|uniref:Aspartic peptidase domain-containing protein n=1 Tax=Chaetomium tenue TaxID=1854479 RepID=A0ACB7PNQ0_9PEZI|nr:aspartic peptidase domain-containing protein [Chaetomium globosum]